MIIQAPFREVSVLLVVDVGNTNIVIGGFDADRLSFEFRLKTERGRTIDEYAALLSVLISKKAPTASKIESCVISSVVPPVTGDLIAHLRDAYSIEPLLVGPGIKTGLPIRVQEPQAVGSDRIVNAVAAKALIGNPALIIDFGTATSLDILSADGCYDGGIIAPGPNVAMESLVANTAKLPRIELAWPKSVIGKNTIHAMQAGCVVGYACMVDGLIERVVAEAGPFPHVVATGGLGQLFAKHSSKISRYEPHLTLHGLRVLAELNR